jgi:hypothetical protein
MQEIISNFANLEYKEIIKAIEHIYVMYPRLQDVYNKIDYCHQYSKITIEPKCMLIKGLSGTGKSSFLNWHIQRFPRTYNDYGVTIPVLTATTPVPATVKSLATSLLESLRDPAAEKGTVTTKTRRLVQLIISCDVELIILDEFQHFIDRDSQNVLQTISDWLKNLIIETKKPMVLIGMPYSDRILEANPQLQRRFSTRVSIDPFKWSTNEDRIEFRQFLYAVEQLLPFNKPSNLADESLALRMFVATGGIVAAVMSIICKASELALKSKEEYNISRNFCKCI